MNFLQWLAGEMQPGFTIETFIYLILTISLVLLAINLEKLK